MGDDPLMGHNGISMGSDIMYGSCIQNPKPTHE